jgi:predicted branched-subunit amino acid permease
MTLTKEGFQAGQKDGITIAAGYFAVSFALGIAMANAGIGALPGFIMSFLNIASAGEYAATEVIAENGSYLQMALITLIANARYLLMSCAFSQKFSPDTPMVHRLLCGYGITDEHFAIAVSHSRFLDPCYLYGAMSLSIPCWAIGTALGITLGNILPIHIISALSVALYGMFLAIIIPPCRKQLSILIIVASSFLSSWLCGILPYVSSLSSGTRTILLTVLIAGIAAFVKPIGEDGQ